MAKKQKQDNKPKTCPFCGSKKILYVHADEHDESIHHTLVTYHENEDHMEGCDYISRYECDKDHVFYVDAEETEEDETEEENEEEDYDGPHTNFDVEDND
jgi:hypothetical protein